MSLHESLKNYLILITDSAFKLELGNRGSYLTLYNSGKGGAIKSFQASLDSIIMTLEDINKNLPTFIPHQNYEEKSWRDLGSEFFSDLSLNSLITVQTKPVFTCLSKIISWANGIDPKTLNDQRITLDSNSINNAINKLEKLSQSYLPKNTKPLIISNDLVQLPKPFLLLAGISGTGKSRFVREQARMQSDSRDLSYLAQIAVRPDWHEPSDLLGYVSRIGGEHYVATPFLKFIAKAWRDAYVSVDDDGFYTLNPDAKTHWVCLDEMNLAPVEQYFADYLSLIETRKWRDGQYRCDAIFKPFELPFTNANKESALNHLAEELGFANGDDALWLHFCSKDVGMPIPPNLIVAGTVNMDETTHGFSRKVIDRALTIDFGVFFPNDFATFLAPKTTNKKISYSIYSDVEGVDLSALKYTAADGTEVRMLDASIALMTEINAVVKDTPFELAYRALNEMLVALACYAPTDEPTLHAVWDDFLMGKLLPRLEGDADKLGYEDGSNEKFRNSLLTKLSALLATRLHSGDGQRPDLLRENKDGTPLRVEYRSLEKLDWMQKRLVRDSFTSFWP